jgi:hypothetical protein
MRRETKTLIFAVGAAAMCSAGALAATHTPVTITGCVHAGTEPDTYVLLDVDEVSGNKAGPAGAVYWLSSTKGLKERVGQKVEVRGTYSLDRDLGKTAKLKIQSDPAKGEETIALENGMKKAEIKQEPRAVGTAGVVAAQVKRPYRRLDVQRLRMIVESCGAP